MHRFLLTLQAAELTAVVVAGLSGFIEKHVWSPAGGWYAQPANWKRNTFVLGSMMFGLVGVVWMVGARLEHRDKMPEEGRFFPSR